MKDWIKVGNKVYVRAYDTRLGSREADITKVGKKYFYIDTFTIPFSIEELSGGEKGYTPSHYVYQSKVHYDYECEISRKRRVVADKIRFLNDSEIKELYDIIIQRDR